MEDADEVLCGQRGTDWFDVDGDGFVAPVDALRILNQLNSPAGSQQVVAGRIARADGVLATLGAVADGGHGFLDVDGDGYEDDDADDMPLGVPMLPVVAGACLQVASARAGANACAAALHCESEDHPGGQLPRSPAGSNGSVTFDEP
mgnify:CR=1 FL=1